MSGFGWASLAHMAVTMLALGVGIGAWTRGLCWLADHTNDQEEEHDEHA